LVGQVFWTPKPWTTQMWDFLSPAFSIASFHTKKKKEVER
jgi:hypothetical protein